MAKSSTTYSEDKRPSRGRGRSFKNKLMDTILNESLLELPEDATKEQAEQAFLSHCAKRAFDSDDSNSSTLLKEFLNKAYPSLKSTMCKVDFEFDSSATPAQQASMILDAASAGDIPPDVATMLIGAIKNASDIEINTDIKERLESLEKLLNERVS